MNFFVVPGGNPLYSTLILVLLSSGVYVFVLTGLGLISELLPVFVRTMFGYKW